MTSVISFGKKPIHFSIESNKVIQTLNDNLPATQWEYLSTTTLNDLGLFDSNFFSL